MAQIDDLLNQASEIRNADQEKENTAQRVGKMLMDIIQHIAGFVSVEGLQAVLAGYAPLQDALVHWRNSRVVCLASMGTDLDNIDGGDWQYSNHTGDIVFNPSARSLSIVGEQGNYSVFPGVIYVNLHSRHCYVWDTTSQAMAEITDSSRPTIIDYRNNPPFAQVAIGESYYFESGTAKKIAIKTSSSGSYSFDPDPKKIYVFKETCESMIWNATTRSWIAIGKNIEVVDNLTEGGRNKALSAEMGKQIKEEIDNLGIEGIVSVDDADLAFIDEDGNIAMRVADGHVETQNFDSRQVTTNTTAIRQLQQQIGQAGGNVQTDVVVKEDSEAAFDVSDASGNVVLRISQNGHIKTKAFDSASMDIFRQAKLDEPQCICHGYGAVTGQQPNTIPYFRDGIAKGYKFFEVDAVNCSDGIPVCTHSESNGYLVKNRSTNENESIQFSEISSADLLAGYTWPNGTEIALLSDVIWFICYFHRFPLQVDGQGMDKASRYAASKYAESLGVGKYVIHEFDANAVYTDWDIPINPMVYPATDIVSQIQALKKADNNVIFSFPTNFFQNEEAMAQLVNTVHEYGCYIKTVVTGTVETVRQWFKRGFDFVITSGITNNNI